jgi:NADH dehydrogenase FAD-containing subunit
MKTSNVIVVGGSFAGLKIAKLISNPTVRVTIIDPRNYFEYTPGILHVLAGSSSYSRISLKMEDIAKRYGYPPGCEYIQGIFAGFEPENFKAYIITNNTEETVKVLEYDAIVICTGSPYISPIKASRTFMTYEERIAELKEFSVQLDRSKSVLITGGGLVGVELAAEIVSRLPRNRDGSKKSVTLLTRSTLLDTLPKYAGKLANWWLTKNGVDVIMNDEKDPNGQTSDHEIFTMKGRRLVSDMSIDCTGVHPKAAGNFSFREYHDKILSIVDRQRRSGISDPKKHVVLFPFTQGPNRLSGVASGASFTVNEFLEVNICNLLDFFLSFFHLPVSSFNLINIECGISRTRRVRCRRYYPSFSTSFSHLY